MMLYLVISEIISVRSYIPDNTKQGTILLVSNLAKILIMSGHGNGFVPLGQISNSSRFKNFARFFFGGVELHEELEFKLSFFINKKIIFNNCASSMVVGCEVCL